MTERTSVPSDFLPRNWGIANRSTVSAFKRLQRAMRRAHAANRETQKKLEAERPKPKDHHLEKDPAHALPAAPKVRSQVTAPRLRRKGVT